ncbi:Glycosyltransferase family 4 protein [Vibrio chagasii]|nr:Glycosyltransferase family 4 protein [Vibrio chagasii]
MNNLIVIAGANSIHTRRWVNAISSFYKIHLITRYAPLSGYDENVTIYDVSERSLLNVILLIRRLSKTLSEAKLHVYRATFDLLLCRLACVEVDFVSVWGADVFAFPDKSPLHRYLVVSNLKSTHYINSTSNVMRVRVDSLLKGAGAEKVTVIPFGIATSKFRPIQTPKSNKFVIGTVKRLEDRYGIDTLIKAFSQFSIGKSDVELKIYGEGPSVRALTDLTNKLSLSDIVSFCGYVDNESIPNVLNDFDVFCAFSRDDSESFGVAILEACSCEKPVIVSDVSGFKEVVIHEETGYIVEREDIESIVNYMQCLYEDQSLREKFGIAGRKHVLDNYQWDECVDRQITQYNNVFNCK